MSICILELVNLSVPVIKLTPLRVSDNYDTIVYAHGNSSDLYDGLRFMERMAYKY